MKPCALFALVLAASCSQQPLAIDVDPPTKLVVDGGPLAPARAAELTIPAGCPDVTPPQTLACTGLYTDFSAKRLSNAVRPYAPAIPLWSDGADKARFVYLPPGTSIDATIPNEWVFPDGTRLWKEFSKDGHRIETRLWQKVHDNFWVNAVYAWNADETSAVRSAGGDVPAGAGTYHIPTQEECEKCHRGRQERILGFEQVELGLPGATGFTLSTLIAEKRISPIPAKANYTIGDDGTGVAAPALAWLHANCGLSCHNGNSGSTAYGAKMRLRLDANLLDGRSLVDVDARTTTIGVKVNAPNWAGQTRIVPGDPDNSLLHRLISRRGSSEQMPPIASRVVDQEGVALIARWISGMSSSIQTSKTPPSASPGTSP